MIQKEISLSQTIDIENLGFDAGAHILVRQGLVNLAKGESLFVVGNQPHWEVQLAAWCRAQGHPCEILSSEGRSSKVRVVQGGADSGRWRDAHKISVDAAETAAPQWGLAARGATVELGTPEIDFRLSHKNEIWAESIDELYKQALSAQWHPDEAIDWKAPFNLPDVVENAVVQVMTYMIENEVAALVVPARFLGQVHPHYREVQAILALQINDEARHIDVFTRRVRLKGKEPLLSTAGGQASLKTLLDENDFSVSGFLLSVLGEGTFVTLLNFLHNHAPDPVTKQIARLASKDESRHVAFGMNHLLWRLEREPEFRTRLANAVQTRNEALAATSGLNEEVFDALVILAAGEFIPGAIAQGYKKVQTLMLDMSEGRRTRLARLGFDTVTAEKLSALHTRNFM